MTIENNWRQKMDDDIWQTPTADFGGLLLIPTNFGRGF
jgi:hypothetical protein